MPNGRRLCTIVACGGYDWHRFGHLIEKLETYARDEACQAIEIRGRPGLGTSPAIPNGEDHAYGRN